MILTSPKGIFQTLSRAENLNFPPKTVSNFFKFSAQDSDLEYLFLRGKILQYLLTLESLVRNLRNENEKKSLK